MNSSSGNDPLVGQTLGRYRILEKIGAGGMGEVYLARDERLEREVALKVLRAGILSDETVRNRFRKEALTLSKLNHPNIATIFDFDSHAGIDFLVMEYVAGESLQQRLRSGPLSEQEVARLGLQLAEGLAAAHAQGIVHRDLKPGNVHLTPDGRLKILDFGLAKLVRPLGETAETVLVSEAGGLTGTPLYMAPEQLRGQTVDLRADIWGAGMVLYEMLTGQHPFRAASRDQLYHAILNRDPPSISKLRPDVPRRLEETTVRALEKRPGDRFPSAASLAENLAEVVRLFEASAELSRGRRVLSRRARRRRGWLAVGVLAVITAAVLVFGLRQTGRQSPGVPALAVIPLASLVGGDLVDEQARMLARMLITDLGESSNIRVLGTAALQNILTNLRLQSSAEISAPDLDNIACSANLSHIVTLSCYQGGGTLRADIEILAMDDGQTVATASEEVAGEENLVLMIDPLAGKTREALLSEKQLASEQDRPFGDITSHSYQAVALFYQGLEFDNQGNAIRAVELYDQALAQDPDFVLARLRRAALLGGNEASLEVGDDERLSEYERLAITSQNALATGDLAGSLAYANEMLELRRADWLSLHMKYCAEYFLGQYEQAVETCELAIRNGYRGYIEHLFLNSSYAMIGLDTSQIIARYHSFLEQDPSDAMMKFWLAMAHLVLNQDGEAQELLDVVFELHPDNDTLLKVTADTYTWRDSADKGADYEYALTYLGRMREHHIAHRAYTDDLPLDTEDYDWLYIGAPISFTMGEIYFLQGKLDLATAAYERSLELKPDHYRSFYRLGQVYDQQGDSVKAVDFLERYIGVKELNWYDDSAQGRETGCAATKACHSISRPVALDEARQRLERLR